MRHLVELVDDRPWRAFRQEECGPGRDIKTSQALLMRARQIRHQLRARLRQDRERLHLFAEDQRRSRAEIAAQVIDLPADQVVRGRRRAAIRHMGDLTPMVALSSAQARCVVEPAPAEPYCILAPFAFRSAANCGMLSAARSLRASSTIGCSDHSVTGVKSLAAS